LVVLAYMARFHRALIELTGSLAMFMFHTLLAGNTLHEEPGMGAAEETVCGATPTRAQTASRAETIAVRFLLMVIAIGIGRRYG
jgi:hypothetical protein